jgi:hypothetical protein
MSDSVSRGDVPGGGARTRCTEDIEADPRHATGRGLLMVSVAYPRECTQCADHDSNVRDDSHGKNGVVVYIEVSEVVYHLEQQPEHARQGAAAVDTSEMLQDMNAMSAEVTTAKEFGWTWRTDVQPSLHHKGAHYEIYQVTYRLQVGFVYLGEARVDNQIQKTAERFVSHQLVNEVSDAQIYFCIID